MGRYESADSADSEANAEFKRPKGSGRRSAAQVAMEEAEASDGEESEEGEEGDEGDEGSGDDEGAPAPKRTKTADE